MPIWMFGLAVLLTLAFCVALLVLGGKFVTWVKRYATTQPVVTKQVTFPVTVEVRVDYSKPVRLSTYHTDEAGMPRSNVDDNSTWGRAMHGFDQWGPDYIFKIHSGTLTVSFTKESANE